MEADSNITLRQLRYFVAAAETGQFSMAATRSHVSQSAITNAVLLLEQTLGTQGHCTYLSSAPPHIQTTFHDAKTRSHSTTCASTL